MSGTKQMNEIKIDYRPVLKNLGYDPPENSPVRIRSLIEVYMEKALRWITPTYNYVLKDVKGVSGNLSYIEGDIIFESDVIARLLERCHKVAVFALTIGSTLENVSAGLAEYGHVLKASVMDAIGSTLAEKTADDVQSCIAAAAVAKNLAVSRRFSPGYCDWHVSQQKMVFKALGGRTSGIWLTSSGLMIPRKSVSGIIGLGPFGLPDSYVPCRTCEKNHKCPWRRF